MKRLSEKQLDEWIMLYAPLSNIGSAAIEIKEQRRLMDVVRSYLAQQINIEALTKSVEEYDKNAMPIRIEK